MRSHSDSALVSYPVSSPLSGTLDLPGDKSISHRALMFSAIADGNSELTGVLEGEDCLRTADALRALGVKIQRIDGGHFRVRGVGLRGLRGSDEPLDFGNSGTGMRLMSGLLAAQHFNSILVGDASLSARPMRRVTDPLNGMGACIETVDGHAPIRITAAPSLSGIQYHLPIASAQLKSALLIAGLFAEGRTILGVDAPSRDHTERMLSAMGAQLTQADGSISIEPCHHLDAKDVSVPADLSSAAFFLVAASILPDSALSLPGVGVNPTRDGVVSILEMMGANIEKRSERLVCGEPVADLYVRSSPLRGVEVPAQLVPLAIDEFPVLFIAAACAEGTSAFSGLAELRHKESDRITAMTTGLRALGIVVEEGEDWVRITGGRFSSGEVHSHGDHRIAMAFAIAASMARGPISIREPENIATSFPTFSELAAQAGLNLEYDA
ncbi:MAG: 3-phosphoshikimate 1-carboxyvinyltransferase [Pseudomonadota bacterium]